MVGSVSRMLQAASSQSGMSSRWKLLVWSSSDVSGGFSHHGRLGVSSRGLSPRSLGALRVTQQFPHASESRAARRCTVRLAAVAATGQLYPAEEPSTMIGQDQYQPRANKEGWEPGRDSVR